MHKNSLIAIIFLLSISDLLGQTSYKGFIGNDPIELVTYIYSDGDARAIYSYKKNNEPIIINGRLNGDTLILNEKDTGENNIASLTFKRFDAQSKTLKGSRTDLKAGKELAIILNKEFDIDYGDSIEWGDREIIQPVSLTDQYFKLIISKAKGIFYANVTGVKIIDKKTDSIIQKIDINCQLGGLHNISIGDYNFDGSQDFSVFESSYAGPNTSSLYFLYDPKTGKYFDSGFSGVSLDFDSSSKTVFEHNECCMGRTHTTAIYKIEKNKMVLVEEHCYKWDDSKQDLVERKMEECQ